MPSINEKGRETDKVVLPEDAVVVPPEQANEYGYWGVRPDTTPQEEHTFGHQAKKLRESQQGSAGQSGEQKSSAATSQSPQGRRGGRHGSTEENR